MYELFLPLTKVGMKLRAFKFRAAAQSTQYSLRQSVDGELLKGDFAFMSPASFASLLFCLTSVMTLSTTCLYSPRAMFGEIQAQCRPQVGRQRHNCPYPDVTVLKTNCRLISRTATFVDLFFIHNATHLPT